MTLEHGMDSSRIRQVASGIDIEAGRLGDILGRGNASAGLLRDNWGGDDSQQLLIRWQREAARSLGAATELLRGAAKELRQQAQDQDEGSGVGGGGTGGPGGPGPGPGSQRPISGDNGSDGKWPDGPPSGYDILDRGPDSVGVRTNRDESGTLHHYDPLTGKTWQESPGGTWTESRDRFGNRTGTWTETTEGENGWERSRSTTEGTPTDGPAMLRRDEWGRAGSVERSFDNDTASRAQAILDNVQSEPIVEQDLWDVGARDQVAQARAGDEETGASAEFLAYDVSTAGTMGIDATRGAYIEANAEAGAYLGRAEAHWTGDHGTTAQAEAMIGAEAEATAGAQIGPAGAQVGAGFEAFAGGRIEGGFSQDIGPADVGASGSISYGIGAHAEADAELSMDRVGVSFDVGATLGIGGSISLDVSISPNEIVDGLADVGEALADSPINPGNWW
ncbi:MAG: WXG100 family type VII secretion target [Janibacter sp.]|nr:WXG100 family type VII secretion target [Janibacter sp.]